LGPHYAWASRPINFFSGNLNFFLCDQFFLREKLDFFTGKKCNCFPCKKYDFFQGRNMIFFRGKKCVFFSSVNIVDVHYLLTRIRKSVWCLLIEFDELFKLKPELLQMNCSVVKLAEIDLVFLYMIVLAFFLLILYQTPGALFQNWMENCQNNHCLIFERKRCIVLYIY